MRTTYNNFIGGVNNFTDPQKLGPADAVDIVDADVSTGSVHSIKLPKDISMPAIPAIVNNPDGQRSVVRFGEDYYWSNNDTTELSSTIGYMGIAPPQHRLDFIRTFPGNRFAGEYRYAVMFRTKEGFSSTPGPPWMADNYWITVSANRQEVDIRDLDAAKFSTTKKVNPGSGARTSSFPGQGYGYPIDSIVEHDGQFYLASVDVFSTSTRYGKEATADCTVFSWGSLGSKGPPECYWEPYDAPTVGPNGVLMFARFNFLGWQYVNELPTPIDDPRWENITSFETLVTGTDSIDLQLPVSRESFVNEVVILRTTANGAIFFEVGSVPNGQITFNDSVSDQNLLLAPSPSITNAHQPILWDDTYVVGGKFLTELHEIFFLAAANRLYVSEQSNPHGWDPLKFLQFDETITALVPGDQSIIVFTHNHRYLITGTSFADVTKKQMPTAQGCPNWRTTATVGNHIVWQSNDGVAVFGKQRDIEGDRVELLTAKRYVFDTIANFAVAANEVYYLFFDDHVVAIDFKHDLKITRLDLKDYISAYYDQALDRLYFQSPLSWQEAYQGDEASWTYITPRLEPVTEEKGESTRGCGKLRRLWIDADNTVDLDVYIDGEFSWSKTIAKRPRRDLHTYFRSGIVGQDVQFRFRSKGVMRSFTIDYRISRG